MAKLILLYKREGKPIKEPSSFRLICRIDTTTKALERLVMERLRKEILLTGGFSGMHYGFEKGKRTVDAIMNVWKESEKARASRSGGKKLCVLIKLDVQNVLNSAPWHSIDEALRFRGSMPMVGTIKSYLSERPF